MREFYSLLADILVGLHFLYVAFVVGGEILICVGGCLKWKWVHRISFRISHLIAIAIVAAQDIVGVLCPLTVWEYQLRELAGQKAEWEITFVGRLFRAIIYYDFPDWFFSVLYIGFALLVAGTLILVPPKRKKHLQ